MKHACLKSRLIAALVVAWVVAGCTGTEAISAPERKQDFSKWTPPSCEELVPSLLEKVANGRRSAAYVLAEFYETDEPCLAKDMVMAARFYRRAAELGDMDAMVRLGFQYTTGLGVEADHVLARRWFKRAVLTTVRDRRARRWRRIEKALGDRGVPEALREEIRWIEGVVAAVPGKRYRIALQLRDGEGLPRDGDAALALLFSIQHKGGPEVRYEIGRGLISGEYPYVPTPPPEGVEMPDAAEIAEMGRHYLRSAGIDGHIPALISLAQSYAQGVDGVCYPASAYALLVRALSLGAEVQDVSRLQSLVEQRLSEEQKTGAKEWGRSRWSFLGPDAESAIRCP